MRTLLVVAIAFVAACGGDSVGSPAECGDCPNGEVCGPKGVCQPVCSNAGDCGGCGRCDQGVCATVRECADPCAACTSEQACVADTCATACGAGLAACPDGQQCTTNGSISYCQGTTELRVLGGGFVAPGGTSSNTQVMVRGRFAPLGGVVANDTHRVTPPID